MSGGSHRLQPFDTNMLDSAINIVSNSVNANSLLQLVLMGRLRQSQHQRPFASTSTNANCFEPDSILWLHPRNKLASEDVEEAAELVDKGYNCPVVLLVVNPTTKMAKILLVSSYRFCPRKCNQLTLSISDKVI
jgi:hypothetical protein